MSDPIPRSARDDAGTRIRRTMPNQHDAHSTDPTMPQHRLTVQESLTHLPGPAGERYVELFKHGTLSVELYAPRGRDPQQPHTRDEVYVVAQGSGYFRNGETRHRFAPGDLLFVPAGAVHRFEDFSDDLAVWVLFYGPEGGEAPQ